MFERLEKKWGNMCREVKVKEPPQHPIHPPKGNHQCQYLQWQHQSCQDYPG